MTSHRSVCLLDTVDFLGLSFQGNQLKPGLFLDVHPGGLYICYCQLGDTEEKIRGTQCTFHSGHTHTSTMNTHEHGLMELAGRHPLAGISVGSWDSLVVNADADTVRMRTAWKSKALINTDDSAPFHRAVSVCVCLCVCVEG